MNTRLQVEHPVTELVTALDLVELQLRVAAGEPLALEQDALRPRGHAVEARAVRRGPGRRLPARRPARCCALRRAAPACASTAASRRAREVGTDYDPMLAKVIAHGPDRATALGRLDRALAELASLGLTTNAAFLRALLAREDVRAGEHGHRADRAASTRRRRRRAPERPRPRRRRSRAARRRARRDDPWRRASRRRGAARRRAARRRRDWRLAVRHGGEAAATSRSTASRRALTRFALRRRRAVDRAATGMHLARDRAARRAAATARAPTGSLRGADARAPCCSSAWPTATRSRRGRRAASCSSR